MSRLTWQVSISIIGALLLAIACLSAYIWGVPIIGGGLVAELETRTEQRDTARKEIKVLIDAGEQRKAAAKKALAEAKPRIERVTTDIERIRAERPAEGKCETLDSIMSADL